MCMQSMVATHLHMSTGLEMEKFSVCSSVVIVTLGYDGMRCAHSKSYIFLAFFGGF